MSQGTIAQTFSAVDLAFRFKPGCQSLNLVATVGERGHRDIERLRSPTDLARWCVQAGLLTEPPKAQPEDVEATKMLREAIYRVAVALRQGDRPQQTDIDTINAGAALPPPIPQLRSDGCSVATNSDKPIQAVLSFVARDAIALFSGPKIGRIKECAEPTCRMLFLDTSRPGRRRWCAMEGRGCGNRAKKAAFRQRQKQVLESSKLRD
jgi:predicted RNA-binding Zn ribbon-like protein